MQYAVVSEPSLPEPMTWAQICQRYPETWVYLIDIEWEPRRVLEIGRAVVVDHARTRKQLAQQVRDAGDAAGHVGPYFTGVREVVVATPQWLR